MRWGPLGRLGVRRQRNRRARLLSGRRVQVRVSHRPTALPTLPTLPTQATAPSPPTASESHAAAAWAEPVRAARRALEHTPAPAPGVLWAVGYVIGGFVIACLGCVAAGVKISADHRRRKRAAAAHLLGARAAAGQGGGAAPAPQTGPPLTSADGSEGQAEDSSVGEEAGGVWGGANLAANRS